MQQLGHTDPAFTLRAYSHIMRRSEDERERLKALVEGHDWSHIGHKRPNRLPHALKRTPTEKQKPRISGAFIGTPGFEPGTSPRPRAVAASGIL
jgi:hypothetical protein